jgi:hypothetical protein
MLDELNLAVAADGYIDEPFTFTPMPTAPVQAETTDLEIPAPIWKAMFAAYAVFFGGLLVATGREAGALFMVVVSILYTLMYFGTASLLMRQNMPAQRSLFARGLGPLKTWTGPMGLSAVAAQILTIPFCFAFFGIMMVVFRVMLFD